MSAQPAAKVLVCTSQGSCAQLTASTQKTSSGTSPQHLTAATSDPEAGICLPAPLSWGLQQELKLTAFKTYIYEIFNLIPQ